MGRGPDGAEGRGVAGGLGGAGVIAGVGGAGFTLPDMMGAGGGGGCSKGVVFGGAAGQPVIVNVTEGD